MLWQRVKIPVPRRLKGRVTHSEPSPLGVMLSMEERTDEDKTGRQQGPAREDSGKCCSEKAPSFR